MGARKERKGKGRKGKEREGKERWKEKLCRLDPREQLDRYTKFPADRVGLSGGGC